jgi:hypothetical protein
MCWTILPKSEGTKTRLFGRICSGIGANLMFQDLNPAHIQWLAFDFVCRGKRESSEFDFAIGVLSPQFFAF